MVGESESKDCEKVKPSTTQNSKKISYTHTMFREPQPTMSSKKEMMMQGSLGVISAIVTSYALPTLFANVR